jgi:hypothetical protein
MCHKILSFDSGDFDNRQFLTMADGLMIAFAAFHLESELLFSADVLDHVSGNRSASDSGGTDGDFAIVVDEEHAVKSDRLAGINGQAFDFKRIARGDAILFASGF